MDKNGLAIKGGAKTRSKPFNNWPDLKEKDIAQVVRMIKNKALWRGLETPKFWDNKTTINVSEKFENSLSNYMGSKYVFSLNSGTTALIIACKALLRKGDEVIVSPYTYFASASSIKEADATPVFADISQDTLNIDIKSIRQKITKKTKALMIVHFGGIPVEMEPIYQIVQKYDLAIIEDCAHVINAKWNGKNVGTLGTVGCFSFQGTKLITAGEGGAIACNDRELANMMFSLHNAGRVDSSEYRHELLGGNYRISEIQSALLTIGWEYFFEQEKIRKINAEYFYEKISKIDGITAINNNNPLIERNYYIMAIRYNSIFFEGLTKKRFVLALNTEGIPCSPGYVKGLYKNPLFSQNDSGDSEYAHVYPETEKACNEIVWFPHHLFLGKKDDIDDIITAIYKIKENVRQILPKKRVAE
jgi:dTDP-4-amino-4,6-dideoxygalactose transaminase